MRLVLMRDGRRSTSRSRMNETVTQLCITLMSSPFHKRALAAGIALTLANDVKGKNSHFAARDRRIGAS